MREDMFKVIVERPRHGSHYAHPARKRALDDLPNTIGMKRHALLTQRRHKSLNENLKPLKRYLGKQVGRPWDKIYSEISATLAPGHTVKEHVRQHIDDYVVRKISIGRNGEWVNNRKFGARTGTWYQPFYVDPRDGILKDSAKLWKKLKIDMKPWRGRKDEGSDDVRPFEAMREFRRIEGIWYEIVYDCRPDAPEGNYVFDLVTHKRVSPRCRYASAKRQLAKSELQLYQLINQPSG